MPGGESDEPLAALLSARVRRVDLPAPTLVAFSLALGELRTVLLVSLETRAVRLGCVLDRPKGEPASGFATFLRTHVEGSALVAADAVGTALELAFRRESGVVSLYVEPSPNLVAVRDERVIGAWSVPRLRERGLSPGATFVPPTDGRAVSAPGSLDALLAEGAALVMQRTERDEEGERGGLLRALKKERARVARRLSAIEADAARALDAPKLRAEASALLSHASRIQVLRTEQTLDLDGLVVTLPPSTEAPAHAQALFSKAKKTEAGSAMARVRADEARAELERLDTALVLAEADDADVAAITKAAGVRAPARSAGPAAKEERLPYRTFRGHAGRPILVGRGSRDNDVLTTKVARPHDLWLHIRGAHGSHVVVPLERGESCPAELLVDAAHLAVRFSELEGTTDADVTYVERRHVRKPRGAAPGAVTFERDKTLALRVEPERLERLLRGGAG